MKLHPPPPGLAVVKVGGSLFDHPDLGTGLRAYLDQLEASKILVVAGGGIVADAVRELDHWQEIGEEKSHELALLATEVSMHFLRDRLGFTAGGWTTAIEWWRAMVEGRRVICLGAWLFLRQYENELGRIPHSWEFTTDSIAALAASVARARVILLKSIDIPHGCSWEEAASRGWVDGCFPAIVAGHALCVEAINFRRWLDTRKRSSLPPR